MDKKLLDCSIFIDLQKAFDTVNHEILLDKSHCYGTKGTANNWFNTFLKNRYQFTNIKKSSSEKQKTTHGVPQGAVLGPLSFLLYINDLNKSIIHSSVHQFADDTNLLLVVLKKINKFVNHDLKHLCQ